MLFWCCATEKFDEGINNKLGDMIQQVIFDSAKLLSSFEPYNILDLILGLLLSHITLVICFYQPFNIIF